MLPHAKIVKAYEYWENNNMKTPGRELQKCEFQKRLFINDKNGVSEDNALIWWSFYKVFPAKQVVGHISVNKIQILLIGHQT